MRNKLVIKFWNEQIAEVSKRAVGDKVQIRNVVIQVFNGVKSVSSTEDTEIEVQYDKVFFHTCVFLCTTAPTAKCVLNTVATLNPHGIMKLYPILVSI